MKIKIQNIGNTIEMMYFQHNDVLTKILKAILGVIIFTFVTFNYGVNPLLSKFYVPILMAIVSIFLPIKAIVSLGFVLIGIHLYTFNLLFLVLYVVLIMLMYLLVFRFCADRWWIAFFSVFLFGINIPYIAPLILGLLFGPSIVIPGVLATVLSFFLKNVAFSKTALKNAGNSKDVINDISSAIMKFLKDPAMMAWILIMIVVILTVSIVRTFNINNSKEIAIIVGSVVELIMIFISNAIFKASLPLVFATLLTIISFAIMVVLVWMLYPLNYSETQYVEFYDDDYYYFVKAVPFTPKTKKAFNNGQISIKNKKQA